MGRVFATLADQAREKRAKAQRTRRAYAKRQAKANQDVTREHGPYVERESTEKSSVISRTCREARKGTQPSDHAPVWARFRLPGEPEAPGDRFE